MFSSKQKPTEKCQEPENRVKSLERREAPDGFNKKQRVSQTENTSSS